MGYVSIPTDISGKANSTPDYDSGCFSLTAGGYIVKTHSLNSKKIMTAVYFGGSDTDCENDGTSGAGKPLLHAANPDALFTLYSSGLNTVELTNRGVSTTYYRILAWKG